MFVLVICSVLYLYVSSSALWGRAATNSGLSIMCCGKPQYKLQFANIKIVMVDSGLLANYKPRFVNSPLMMLTIAWHGVWTEQRKLKSIWIWLECALSILFGVKLFFFKVLPMVFAVDASFIGYCAGNALGNLSDVAEVIKHVQLITFS